MFISFALTKISKFSSFFYHPNPNPNRNLQHRIIFAPAIADHNCKNVMLIWYFICIRYFVRVVSVGQSVIIKAHAVRVKSSTTPQYVLWFDSRRTSLCILMNSRGCKPLTALCRSRPSRIVYN